MAFKNFKCEVVTVTLKTEMRFYTERRETSHGDGLQRVMKPYPKARKEKVKY